MSLKKTEHTCEECDSKFIVLTELDNKTIVGFCPFCNEVIGEDVKLSADE